MPAEPIKVAQNSESSLRLLAAQRQLYTEAKNLNKWLFVLAALSATAIPCILYFVPSAEGWWGLAGLAVFAINELLKSNEEDKRETASLIQEQLDTQLYGIPWNSSSAGEPVSPEIIVAAESRFKGSREGLKNWYSAPKHGLPHNLTALLCQRENLVWEYRQRQSYIRWMSALFFLALVAIVALGLAFEVLLFTFLVKYLAPVLPLLWLIGKGWLSHRKTAETLHQKEKGITSLLMSGELIPEGITAGVLRNYQDAVLQNRQAGPMVPDWFYNSVGKRISNEVNQATAMIIQKLAGDGAGR